MRRLTEFLFVLAVIGSDLAVAQSKLPNAPVREVTDDYFGTKVTDPYRWIENTKETLLIAPSLDSPPGCLMAHSSTPELRS